MVVCEDTNKDKNQMMVFFYKQLIFSRLYKFLVLKNEVRTFKN